MDKSTTKPFYSASKDQHKTLRQKALYLKIRDRTFRTRLSVVNNLAIDVLLRIAFIGEGKVAILPKVQKVTARDSNSVAIREQGNTPASVFLNTTNIEK